MKLHSLLLRQLRRHFGDRSDYPTAWERGVHHVNASCLQSDGDRAMLERSLELSSHEILQANSEMHALLRAFPDLIFRLDREGTILEYRAGRATDFFAPPTSLVGKRIQ